MMRWYLSKNSKKIYKTLLCLKILKKIYKTLLCKWKDDVFIYWNHYWWFLHLIRYNISFLRKMIKNGTLLLYLRTGNLTRHHYLASANDSDGDS